MNERIKKLVDYGQDDDSRPGLNAGLRPRPNDESRYGPDDTVADLFDNDEEGNSHQREEKAIKIKFENENIRQESEASEVEILKEDFDEPVNHVTFNETVEVYHVNSIHNEDIMFNKVDDSSRKYGPNISDPNLKRKVTFSNEIIVITYDDEEGDQVDNTYDQEAELGEPKEENTTPYRGVFQDKQEELTVSFTAETINTIIFKAVSFSNEITVIDDGNLVFASQECSDLETPAQGSCNVERLLSKLKKVVQKLEDKSKTVTQTRDKKVLGDAEQRSLHQVEIVKLDDVESQLVFTDTPAQQREPNLRKVTFSKEIIVIAYPNDSDGDDSVDKVIDRDKKIIDREKKATDRDKKAIDKVVPKWPVEGSCMTYAHRSKTIGKSVSFSNEVTVIHDRTLRFSESVESLKEDGDRKKMGLEDE